MEWILKIVNYRQEYVDDEGTVKAFYEKGVECTCPSCGYVTGSQAMGFKYCPMCGTEVKPVKTQNEENMCVCATCEFYMGGEKFCKYGGGKRWDYSCQMWTKHETL